MYRHIVSCLFTAIALIIVASCSNNSGETGTASAVLEPVSFTDEGLPGAIYRITGADVTSEDEQLSVKQVDGRELLFEKPENNIWQARIPVDWWGESLQFEMLDSADVVVATYKVEIADHPTLTHFSGGYNHSCVIANGQPMCWGATNVGQMTVLEDSLNPVAITAQNNFTCVQNSKDEIDCSGIQNLYADLRFDGAQALQSSSYQQVSNLETLVSGNYYNASSTSIRYMAISFRGIDTSKNSFDTLFLCTVEQGELRCKGQSADIYDFSNCWNGCIQLSYEESFFDWSVLDGFIGAEISAVAAGFHGLCMIADGKVMCRGLGSKPLPSTDFGADFLSLPLAGLVPPEFDSPTLLAMGGDHACVVDLDSTQCWGMQSGVQIPVPEHIKTPVSITAGYQHFCAIVDGKPYCWGDFCINTEYLWLDETYFHDSCFNDKGMALPTSEVDFVELVSGEAYSCGLSDAGIVECWGWYCELPVGDFYFGDAERECVAANSLTPNRNLMGARFSEIGAQHISSDISLPLAAFGLSNTTFSAESSAPQIVDVIIDTNTDKLTLKVGSSVGEAFVTVHAESGHFSLQQRFSVNVVASQ